MAVRKFMYMDSAGTITNQSATDGITIGGITMNGNIALGSSYKFSGLAAGDTSGDVISHSQSSAQLGATTLSASLDMNTSYKVVNLADGTDSTDGVNYGQLTAAEAALNWKDPAVVLRVKGDDNKGGTVPDPTAYTYRQSFIINNWTGYSDGDIYETDGTQWVKILSNSGGYVPAGTRVVAYWLTTTGNFSGKENQIATANGSGGWTFDGTPSDGDALLIEYSPENDPFGAGHIFIYDDESATKWEQASGGTEDVVAGTGITKTNSTLAVDTGAASQFTITGDAIVADVNSNSIQFNNPDGLAIKLAASPGLEISSGLRVKQDGAHGIKLDTSGIEIKIDPAASNELAYDSGGLKALGLPANFYVYDTQVGSTVTTANVDDLCDGSNVDGLHIHIRNDQSPTAMNAVIGEFTAGEAITANDPVYIDSTNNQILKAQAGDDSKVKVIGIAESAISQGNPGYVVGGGLASSALVGATVGDIYWLDTSGGVSTTRPSSGHSIKIGYASSATDLVVDIRFYGKR